MLALSACGPNLEDLQGCVFHYSHVADVTEEYQARVTIYCPTGHPFEDYESENGAFEVSLDGQTMENVKESGLNDYFRHYSHHYWQTKTPEADSFVLRFDDGERFMEYTIDEETRANYHLTTRSICLTEDDAVVGDDDDNNIPFAPHYEEDSIGCVFIQSVGDDA